VVALQFKRVNYLIDQALCTRFSPRFVTSSVQQMDVAGPCQELIIRAVEQGILRFTRSYALR